ncbi:MAG: PQQ-binding-like beta-propeller repeat protein [Phycisphaerae bacterium]
MRTSLLYGLILVGLSAARADPAVAAGADTAEAIYEATGVEGGLVVHVGCGEGDLTAALRADERYIVHGLATDPAAVAAARARLRSRGVYGSVSVDTFDGKRLPYVDNLVNLVVVDDTAGVPMDEVRRVLAPEGVAYVREGGRWTKTVKPRPDDIDEWTHYYHNATGNAVSRDEVVAPCSRLQWTAGPRWARHHEHTSSVDAMVSAGGRIFYIMDEGPRLSIQLPADWNLICRDAFSGVLLWKRDIPRWYTHLYPLKAGPATLPRRLVAVGDRVYATLGIEAPVSVLDAATGKTVRTLSGTEGAEELLYSDGVLFVKTGPVRNEPDRFTWDDPVCWTVSNHAVNGRAWTPEHTGEHLLAVDAATGEVRWTQAAAVAPLSLAADAERVVFHNGEAVVCLDRATGKRQWVSEEVPRKGRVPTFSGFSLVLHDGVVLVAYQAKMTALDAASGKALWSGRRNRGGHRSPMDLLVIDDLVWSLEQGKGRFTGLDVRTGETKREFGPDVEGYGWFHHRCHNCRATTRYLLAARTGIEFVDWRKQHWDPNHWVRGACLYGFMPANGLTYAPQDPCGCYIEAKLKGLNALAGGEGDVPQIDRRLEKGPAYGKAGDAAAGEADWPTYRHDAARSGCAGTSVPADLGVKWSADVGAAPTSLTVAGGRCFVADVDAHTLHALDARTGETLWTFTAGGRIDSPPTIHKGRALFGCADGYVYSLRVADGALVWRYLAGWGRRRIVARDQVESVWPVHGSVLVVDDALYAVAGRSAFLDGGMRLVRLDADTGDLLSESRIDDRIPGTDKDLQTAMGGGWNLTMPTALPDILSSDGERLYMRSQAFDLEGKRPPIDSSFRPDDQLGPEAHLFATSGFLDDSWFHRTYWLYGHTIQSGCNYWFRAGHYAPSGRIMVFDDDMIYGFGRRPMYWLWTPALEYHLFAAAKKVTAEDIERAKKGIKQLSKEKRWLFNRELTRPMSQRLLSAMNLKWSNAKPDILVRAMVLAGERLVVAGPPDTLDEEAAVARRFEKDVQRAIASQAAALAGKEGARLQVFSTQTGEQLVEVHLKALPVWDGMAAAGGRLYLSQQNGKVICLGDK